MHVFAAVDSDSFVGMHIAYKNGGQRFVGDAGKSANNWICQPTEMRVENPTRLYVETKTHPEILQKVWFSDGDVEGSDKCEFWEGYDLAGGLHFWELHVWCEPTGSYRGEVQVLQAGSWQGA